MTDSSKTNYADLYNLHEENDPEAWKFYKQQVAQRWDPDEIVLSEDKNGFSKLPKRYHTLVEDLVGFFAPGDGLVCEQVDHLKMESKDFAQRAFLGEQYSIEVVHARAYKDIILTLFDPETQTRVFESVDTLPCIREKADFIVKYMNNKELPLSLRYVAAAVSEGVFFVSLFAAIFYLREKKILNRFCFLNEQVAKDEKLHRDFDIMMARRGKDAGEITFEQAREIVQYGIDVEIAHISYILKEPIDSLETDALGGMTIANMERFIKTLGDQIMTGIGFDRCFTYEEDPVENMVKEYSPPWMAGLSMSRKTNFYELPVGNYTMISQRDTKGQTRSAAFGNTDDLGI